MSWFRVDDTLHAHRKVRRAGVEAMGLWVVCGSYASSPTAEGDGCLADDEVEAIALTLGVKSWRKLAATLERVGLWERDATDTGYRFHDWDDYLDGEDSDVLRRAKDSQRKKAARNRQRAARNAIMSADASADSPRTNTETSADIDWTRPRTVRGLSGPSRVAALTRDPVPTRPDPQTPVAPVGVSEPEQTPEPDAPTHSRIRIAFAAGMAAGGQFRGPPDYPEEAAALDREWSMASDAGLTFERFLAVLQADVTAWVQAITAAGEARFTGGWRPSKFAAWAADQHAKTAPKGPVPHSWGEPTDAELGLPQ